MESAAPFGRTTGDDPADRWARSRSGRNYDEAETFVFPASHCYIVGVLHRSGWRIIWKNPVKIKSGTFLKSVFWQLMFLKSILNQGFFLSKNSVAWNLVINPVFWKSGFSVFYLPCCWYILLCTVSVTCRFWAAEPINPTTWWWDELMTETLSTAMISSPLKSRPSRSAAPPGTMCPIET